MNRNKSENFPRAFPGVYILWIVSSLRSKGQLDEAFKKERGKKKISWKLWPFNVCMYIVMYALQNLKSKK